MIQIYHCSDLRTQSDTSEKLTNSTARALKKNIDLCRCCPGAAERVYSHTAHHNHMAPAVPTILFPSLLFQKRHPCPSFFM